MGKCERLRTEECWREEGRNGEEMVRVTQKEWSKKEEGDIRQKRGLIPEEHGLIIVRRQGKLIF